MFTRTARRALPTAVLVAAGLALTACGPGDTPSPASDASSASQGGDDASGGGDAADGAGSSGSSGTGGSSGEGTDSKDSAGGSDSAVPACATSALKITTEDTGSGAGHSTFRIVFQNTGSETCALTGYPGVSFVKEHNTQLGKAASRTDGTTKAVTLIPNAHAYADARTVLGQAGYDEDECDLTTVPTLRVYPPNQKESANIPWNRDECVGSDIQNLQVGPVHGNK